jgi:pimeloyl-ACP methyl ester carboxylesterase
MQESALEFIDNDGVSICVERRGDGPRCVVFAHGWISSRRMWYDVVDRLDPARYRSVLFDFRGCGLSDRPRTAHDFHAYASDLRAVTSRLETPFTLVGHSMGGRQAQYLAAQKPANLERLILIAPGSARALTLSNKRQTMAIAAYGSRERIERFQRAAMMRALSPETMLRIVDDALVCQYEHWTGANEWMRLDFAEKLAAIDFPTLVIAGANDPLAPPSRLKREVAGPIAGSLFVVLKDAGHNLPVEVPAEIAAAVERFE